MVENWIHFPFGALAGIHISHDAFVLVYSDLPVVQFIQQTPGGTAFQHQSEKLSVTPARFVRRCVQKAFNTRCHICYSHTHSSTCLYDTWSSVVFLSSRIDFALNKKHEYYISSFATRLRSWEGAPDFRANTIGSAPIGEGEGRVRPTLDPLLMYEMLTMCRGVTFFKKMYRSPQEM